MPDFTEYSIAIVASRLRRAPECHCPTVVTMRVATSLISLAQAKKNLWLEIPDSDDRYYSVQLIDVYANNFAYIGRRFNLAN